MSTTNSMTFENELITLCNSSFFRMNMFTKVGLFPWGWTATWMNISKNETDSKKMFFSCKIVLDNFQVVWQKWLHFLSEHLSCAENMKFSSSWYLWFQQLGSMTFCLDDNSGAETNIVKIFALQIKYLDCKFKCNFTIVQLPSIRQIRLNSKIAPHTMWQLGKKKRGSSVVKLNSTGLGLRGL